MALLGLLVLALVVSLGVIAFHVSKSEETAAVSYDPATNNTIDTAAVADAPAGGSANSDSRQ